MPEEEAGICDGCHGTIDHQVAMLRRRKEKSTSSGVEPEWNGHEKPVRHEKYYARARSLAAWFL
jgi:hypothetical protein